MLAHSTFLQQSHWIKSVGSYAFIYNAIFTCLCTKKCWGFLFVLAERMYFPKAPMEGMRLPSCSMGKSTLDCLWDPNRKLSVSHFAELPSQAACQHCFRKCSSSAFQAVLQIHTDSCREAFLGNSESEAYRDRRGRHLVLVIRDNLRITRYSLLGVERLSATETGGSSFYGDTLVLALLSLCIFTWVHAVFFLQTGNAEYSWSSTLQPPLKHSRTRRLSLPLH